MNEVEKFIAHFPKARTVRKPRPGKCPLYGCRLYLKPKGMLCPRHSMRLWRLTNPLGAHFAQIKDRAAKRGQVFTITREQFIDLVVDTGYLEARGRGACMLHLDRVDASRGYEMGNVRVITARSNCQKAVEEKKRRTAYVAARIPMEDEDPF